MDCSRGTCHICVLVCRKVGALATGAWSLTICLEADTGCLAYPETVAPLKTDAHLIQIVDAALADAAARSGGHLACRPGCSQCCVGAFAINILDAERLQRGNADLQREQPERFLRVQERVSNYVSRTRAAFPGDPRTGVLDETAEGVALFEEFANDEVCPVLDPESRTCDMYKSRPMTCRVFGPPVRAVHTEGEGEAEAATGLGVCELCFVDASPQEIAACEMIPDPDHLEDAVIGEMADRGHEMTSTIVAYALSTCSSGNDVI